MTTPRPTGVPLYDEGRWGLRYERLLAHPPETVWRAVTESEHLAAWLPCDVVGDRRVGAELSLPFWPAHVERYGIEGPALTGRVLEWDPPRCFAWTWDTDELRFELAPDGDGTRLTFTTWLGDGDAGTEQAAGTGAGYDWCLDRLVDHVAGAPPVALPERAELAGLEAAYREELGRRAPS